MCLFYFSTKRVLFNLNALRISLANFKNQTPLKYSCQLLLGTKIVDPNLLREESTFNST